jgi:hypothetical protein
MFDLKAKFGSAKGLYKMFRSVSSSNDLLLSSSAPAEKDQKEAFNMHAYAYMKQQHGEIEFQKAMMLAQARQEKIRGPAGPL